MCALTIAELLCCRQIHKFFWDEFWDKRKVYSVEMFVNSGFRFPENSVRKVNEFWTKRKGSCHMSTASDPSAPRKCPSPNATEFCTHFLDPCLHISPPLFVTAIELTL
jgi:hypothetical protein